MQIDRRFPMQAADVMTPDPIYIAPDASINEAIQLMLERKFSGLPVVDGRGSLVGIVTEGDLLRRTETGTQRKRPGWIEFIMGAGRLAAEYQQSTGRKVSDVMTPEVRSVNEDAPLEEIVRVMERHQVKRLLVVHGDKARRHRDPRQTVARASERRGGNQPGSHQRRVDPQQTLYGTQKPTVGAGETH
jgi:CBS domain-containing protein